MKKIMLGVVTALMLSSTAHATNYDGQQTVNINGNSPVTIGGINSSCSSFSCGDTGNTINVNGDGNVSVNGSVVTLKGKDGKDGTNGKDGAAGAKGDKGETGAAGKDADVSNLVSKSDYAVDKAAQAVTDGKQDSRLETVENMANGLNVVVGQNKQDIAELQDGKADKSALNQETAERKAADSVLGTPIVGESIARAAGDAALNNKIELNSANQSIKDKAQDTAINGKVDQTQYNKDKATQTSTDKAQNTAISNAQNSANNAQNTANVALGVGIANSIGLGIEATTRASEDAKLQNQITDNKTAQAETDKTQDAATNALNSKVDQNKADQAVLDTKQDLALVNESDARTSADTALYNKIELNANSQAVRDTAQDNVINSKTDQTSLDAESSIRANADSVLNNKIDYNKVAQSKIDADQQKEISSKANQKDLAKETVDRKAEDAKLQHNINHEAKTRAQADAVLSSRIDSNDTTLVDHDQRITSNTQRVGSVEKRQQSFENSTNKRFSDMDKRVGDNRKVASAGIAGAGAMANIPGLTQNSTFSVGAGIGGYDGEQAVAVGFNARVSNNVTTKVTVSTNTQSEVLWGAGVGVEW